MKLGNTGPMRTGSRNTATTNNSISQWKVHEELIRFILNGHIQ